MTPTSRPASADRRLAALFPDETDRAVASPWWRRRGGVTAIVIVVALLASGLVATQAFGSSGNSYRTVTATTENVDAVLNSVATIEPVAQATVAFPVSGKVASVNVAIGDTVEPSGTLASLDTQALTETLHTKQAALAQAQLTLSKALSGQSVGGIGSGGSGSGSSSFASSAATTSSFVTPASTGTARIVLTGVSTDPALAAAQQAVLAAQQKVDAALTAAASALSAETTVCAAFTTSPPSSSDATACQQAIADVLTAQTAVSTAQTALAAASTALDTLLAQRASAPGTGSPGTGSPGTGNSGTGSPGTGSSGTGTSGTGTSGDGSSSDSGSTGSSGSTRSSVTGGSGGSSSPSSADLVAYQQAVDADAAAVAVAQEAVDQATIASPLAGTVVAVNMAVGDSVTSGSSTANIVVQGTGGYEVSTTVSVDNVPSVSVGEPAAVVPDGTHRSVTGRVVAISVMPVSTSSTATLYRVVVGLADPNAKLDNGATGTVSIVTKQAKTALAVPTSAITTLRNRHTVSVLNGGTVKVVPVQVGVVGATWTEIKSGVTKGQQVVLADVSAALPGSATASAASTQGTTGIARFGGAAGGGLTGGFGGGRTNRNG